MCRVIVFAGTTEGYEICRFLTENHVSVCACVATEYGSKSLKENKLLQIRAGRQSEEEMEALFGEISPEMVVDATHPYAREVTSNIRSACDHTGIPCVRVLREGGGSVREAVYVDSPEEAARYLSGTEGNILLTTGSKELAKFTEIPDYSRRLYARVLSLPSVISACAALGLEGKHLIGMQGPFSAEMNVAMLRQFDCRYLVTKDTGSAGGFPEKIQAARTVGAVPVIIGRPVQEEGLSVMECRRLLAQRLGFALKPKVSLVGIGMGGRQTLTPEARAALEEAELLIGARRMVEAVARPGQTVLREYRGEVIADYIREHPEHSHVAVALSGDVGFYSGARKLVDLLGEDTRLVCGISSVAYFMAKLGLPWDDARIVSAHGQDCSLVSLIRRNPKVFSILGTRDGVAHLARELSDCKMGQVLLSVGENLSYPNERIFSRPARELTDYEGDSLSVICARNPEAEPLFATHGIPDGEFLRGKAPMTKEEVRTVSLSKLCLREDSVCYDVGAGTGSVSVEMALRAWKGRVYAVEKKEEALALLEENRKKFAVDNLIVVTGTAPQALADLPAPTHAFIGGSSGNMREILALLLEKNPGVRLVINCITLETVAETMEAAGDLGLEPEIVLLSVARSRKAGRYHMMMGENPIYIISCQRKKQEEGL
ncbi:MAG: precorrin-6A reductase [Clostridiales bacterium]|nr:precorrin-6A reductase [Clostridiales bacterium]